MRTCGRGTNIRNIILLTVDCLRYDAINKYITPNLYNIAKEGMFYANCWSEFGHTLASFQTLFEKEWIYTLKAKGYYTIGINYNAYLSKGWGYEEGFDYWHDVTCRDDMDFRDDSAEIIKLFQNAVDSRRSSGPFFAWLHFMDAHVPYFPFGWDKEMRLADTGVPLAKPTKKIAKRLRRKYEGAVSYIDYNIGNLESDLFLRAWDKETLLIISADHGEEFLEHGKFGHDVQRTCKEVLHIPLLVRGNGIGINKQVTFFKDISKIILNELQ